MKAKRSKFNAVPVVIDNVRFASKAEGRRYAALKLMVRAGCIRDLELQPRYPLVVNGVKVADYVADFRYWDIQAGGQVTEDCKGFRTPVYRLKAKLVWAIYGIKILETGDRR
jgi:ferredoxin-fold anticodon binding domain-containing protein